MRLVVLLGAMMGMISSILVFQLGQARVWFAMSRDRLLPDALQPGASALPHARRSPPGSPAFWSAIPAGLFDIGTLADLSNIGTLFAFVLVSIGVLILRYSSRSGTAASALPAARSLPCSASFSASC